MTDWRVQPDTKEVSKQSRSPGRREGGTKRGVKTSETASSPPKIFTIKGMTSKETKILPSKVVAAEYGKQKQLLLSKLHHSSYNQGYGKKTKELLPSKVTTQ